MFVLLVLLLLVLVLVLVCDCGVLSATENFYNGEKSPFGVPHDLTDHVAEKSYSEIAEDFTPASAGKVAVGCWCVL